MFRALVPSLMLIATSCTPYVDRDDDEDGVPNGTEEEQGTDPTVADSDSDGLTDSEEVDAGTDPLVADSDEDGWNDGDEVEAGTPPGNAYIHPFEEGDYRMGTAATPAEATGPTGESAQEYAGQTYTWTSYQAGDFAENFTLMDEFGQDVDLYAFQGRWIYMTFSAVWCGPCQAAAEELPALQEEFADNMTAVEVLMDDNNGDVPDAEVLQNWHNEFGLDRIPVLSDPEGENWVTYDKDWGIPTMVVINPDMEVVSVDEYVKTAEELEALGL
jgi:peroxiredoxin